MDQRSSNPDIDATRAAARQYLERGWTPIGYGHRTKSPYSEGWQKKTRDKVNVDKDFAAGNSNLGIVLGKPSGDLVDVDLDWPEAVALARYFLPHTGCVFGRPSTPTAHLLYKSAVPATVPYSVNGKRDGMVVELRSNGGQTMFPPSVHPEGERVAWDADGDGTAAEIEADELQERVRRLAVAALILRQWQEGLRNVLGLRVPGALLSHGWTEAEVEKLLTIVARVAGDDERAIAKTLNRIKYTMRRRDTGRPCTGIPKLAEALEIGADILRAWIDFRPEEERGILPSAEPIRIARAFAKTLTDTWHWRSDFYQWSGSWWMLVDDEELKGRLYPWLEKQKVRTKQGIAALAATRTLVADVLAALAGVMQLPNHKETPFWIDPRGDDPQPSSLIPFRNGVFNLDRWQLVKPDQRLFSLHGVDCDYDPDATAPIWQKFMVDAFPKDPDSRPSIEEILGYLISSDRSLHKAFAFFGDKRSGKSTIGRLLRTAVGAGRYVNPKLHDFSETFGMQNMIGKSVAVISDQRGTGKGVHAVENILTITGEDAQSIPRKYKGHWNGILPTGIVLISNSATNLKDPTGVIVTRFIVINFTESFYGRENPNLTFELTAELSGIVNAWLEGYKRLRERGHFVQPETGLEYIEQMNENASPLKTFIDEMCVLGSDYEIPKSCLYDAFTEWATAHGHYRMADSTFGTDLRGLHIGVRAGKAQRDKTGYQRPIFVGITTTELKPTDGKLTPAQKEKLYGDSSDYPF